MKKTLLIIYIICQGMFLFAQKAYPPVEELVYDGYYNWGFIWVKAGRVEFSLTKSDKYPDAQILNVIGYSLPSWDWVFNIRDTLTSIHNAKTFLPYEFSRKAHEGNYHKTFDYRFDYQDSLIYGDIHRIGRFRKADTVKMQEWTYDMLSVAWMARELDFDNFQKNQIIPIKILIDSKIYDLYIRYLGTSRIKADGQRQECYVFSPLLVEGDVFKGGETMKIWVSKDEYRIPIMVETKILVGSVKGIIDRKASKWDKK